jgi:hypothetical protein
MSVAPIGGRTGRREAMPKPVDGKPGWVEGTVQELLGLKDQEMKTIEKRLELIRFSRERGGARPKIRRRRR